MKVLIPQNLNQLKLLAVSQVKNLKDNSFSRGDEQLFSGSRILVVLSVLVTIIGVFFQMRLNYKNHSVEGLSLVFLLLNLGSDVSNLIASLLSETFSFPFSLCSYLGIIDFILIIQFWYYYRIYPEENKDYEEFISEGSMRRPRLKSHNSRYSVRRNRFDGDISRGRDDSRRNSQASAMPLRPKRRNGKAFRDFLAFSYASSTMASPVDGYEMKKSSFNVPQFLWTQGPISVILFTWLFCSFSVISRIPQIMKNHRNYSTRGLSPFLFLSTLASNVCYCGSMVIDIYLLSTYGTRVKGSMRSLIVSQLPSIIRLAGVILLDIFILLQIIYYGNDNDSSSTEATSLTDHGKDSIFAALSRNKIDETVPDHFQTSPWFNNLLPNSSSNMDDQDLSKKLSADYHYIESRLQSAYPSESSMLVDSSHQNYDTLYPPRHYVSSSRQMQSPKSDHKKTIFEAFNAISHSLSRSNSASQLKSVNSNSSIFISSLNNKKGQPSSPIPTSIIPSIVGSASLMYKKMADDSKKPFSPSDFLHEDHSHVQDSASVISQDNISSS